MNPCYRITPALSELRVIFEGTLAAPDAQALEKEIDRMVGVMRVRRYNVLMDMTGLIGYTNEARDSLVRIQTVLADVCRRTAYVANRPNIRGMALWIAHLSGDQNVKAVATREQAQHWWSSQVGRVEEQRRALR